VSVFRPVHKESTYSMRHARQNLSSLVGNEAVKKKTDSYGNSNHFFMGGKH
jgi:hypothetical protein